MLARVSSGEVTQEQGYLQNGQTRRTKIILHFNVHEVYFLGTGCLTHLYVAVPHCWEDDDFYTMFRPRNIDGGEWRGHTPTDPRAYELRFGPMSC